MTDRPTCATCRYKGPHPSESFSDLGKCRRRAPAGDYGFTTIDPTRDWCGEHEIEGPPIPTREQWDETMRAYDPEAATTTTAQPGRVPLPFKSRRERQRERRRQQEEGSARTYANRATIEALLPKMPDLGGGITPSAWLRSRATYDRAIHANARAREAEAIADWIDKIITPEKAAQQDEETAQSESQKGEGTESAPDLPDSPARVRVREQLERVLIEDICGGTRARKLIDQLLHVMRRAAQVPDLSAWKFLDDVKDGTI